MAHGFSLLDGIVLVVYLAGTTGLGLWLGRSQKDARDYFLGNGKISWWAIMLSIVATETSSLTFISIPGLAYLTDLTFVQIALGYLVGRIVVAYTLLPLYFNGDAVTAYALLEKRFGTRVRRVAALTFMVTRVFGDSVRIYATAIPVGLILGALIPPEYVASVSIITLGAFTVLYTYHGGMRAVVWTDVIQTGVYLLGAFAAMLILQSQVSGGWPVILSHADELGKLRVFDLYLGFDKPHTLLAGLLGGGVLAMASHGADQLFVQRLLGAGNLQDARKALIGSGVLIIGQMLLFLLIGIGLHAFYSGQKFSAPDAIFPHFIVEQMPSGLVGLILAAILAAAMSTVSGALSSLAATTLHDLLPAFRKTPFSDTEQLRLSRQLTLAWAVVLVGGALLYTDKETPVVTVALSIASFTYGGLLGAFALALLWKRANQRDAIAGMTLGMALTACIVFAKPLTAFMPFLQPLTGIAWPWFVMIGTGLTFGVGAVSSLLRAEPKDVATPMNRVDGTAICEPR